MVRLLTFGSFDPLHDGHRWLFKEAHTHGDHLTVVVARDSVINKAKERAVHQTEKERLQAVAADENVDQALLGDRTPGSYHMLMTLDFSVLLLGYDQKPSDAAVQQILDENNLTKVRILRLPPFKPKTFKSTLLR